MSWRDAPLYVETHDLAVWTLRHAQSWTQDEGRLASRVQEHAVVLVCAVALALTFPATRRKHLRRADETIVRLRMELRLAGALGLLSARQLRFAGGRLRVIGKMLGGWRKRLEKKRSRHRSSSV